MLLLINNNGTQADRVLNLFQSNPAVTLGASQVWNLVAPGTRVPLTSIRRAISDLTDQGFLVKTAATRISPWHRPEHLYQLKDPYNG